MRSGFRGEWKDGALFAHNSSPSTGPSQMILLPNSSLSE
jgi:hypothetical protein